MSRFPCEFCRGTGVIEGEQFMMSNDWEPDKPCTCVTPFTLQELIIISRLIRVEDNVLYSPDMEHCHGQVIGMRDELWEQLLDKIREGHKEDE